jgi:hypothetical protein
MAAAGYFQPCKRVRPHDAVVLAFRSRPIDLGPALHEDVPVGGSTVSRRGRFGRWTPLLALLALAAGAAFLPEASADQNFEQIVSTGTAGGSGPFDASFRDVSADGSRVWFETAERLVSADTDTSQDVYERSGGTTALVSTGPAGGNGVFGSTYVGSSQDGSHVFFTTREQLVSADTDTSQDLYERSGGTTTLVSTGPDGGNGAFTASFNAVSQDGSKVFFQTSEPLVSADTDTSQDLYQRSGGTTELVSTGPAGGNGAFNALFGGISADGSHVFFQTDEPLTADDTDVTQDVYDRSGGTTTRVSLGPAGGNGTLTDFYDAYFEGASSDGSHVFIETNEPLVSADVDAQVDVYERTGAVTNLLSVGPTGGNDAYDATFRGASANGSHVFFQTAEPLVAADTDLNFDDVYDSSGGNTTLVSTGPVEVGAADTSFVGASSDGSHVFFSTALSLVPLDLDGGWRDLYDRSGGTTTLVSTGPLGGSSPQNAFFAGASDDGSRVFFKTDETLVADDSDGGYTDVYEHSGAGTTLVSIGPAGGYRHLLASFGGSSQDGRRVFFSSAEKLVGSDTDDSQDVYSSVPSATQPVASPVAVSLVPSFRQTISATQCAARGGTVSQHGLPLALTSCNPPAYAPGTQARLGTLSSSSALLAAVPGDLSTVADEGDLAFSATVNDVHAGSPTGPDYAPDASGPDATLVARFRISDLYNGVSLDVNATVIDLELPVPMDCAVTGGPEGSTCAVNTTANALMPGSMGERRSTSIQVFRVRIDDAGANGVRGDGDDRNFAMQGFYVP